MLAYCTFFEQCIPYTCHRNSPRHPSQTSDPNNRTPHNTLSAPKLQCCVPAMQMPTMEILSPLPYTALCVQCRQNVSHIIDVDIGIF
jgi:hypothetical protein